MRKILTKEIFHPYNPFSTFLAIHFEVGGDTKRLKRQESMWPVTADLIRLADEYNAKLTLQFNPQWAEYTLKDENKLNSLKEWQRRGHEIGLHHHGYDHRDWNGYTNRPEKKYDPRFRGGIRDMMELMNQLAHPHQLMSGTISDEPFDYPQGIKYDTEGIHLYHGKSKPMAITLRGIKVIQVSMAFLSFEGDIKDFQREYLTSDKDEVFGVVTHEKDFAKNPAIIEDWFKFIRSRGEEIRTVSEIVSDYLKFYTLEQNDAPLTFSRDVKGVVLTVKERLSRRL